MSTSWTFYLYKNFASYQHISRHYYYKDLFIALPLITLSIVLLIRIITAYVKLTTTPFYSYRNFAKMVQTGKSILVCIFSPFLNCYGSKLCIVYFIKWSHGLHHRSQILEIFIGIVTIHFETTTFFTVIFKTSMNASESRVSVDECRLITI